MRLGFISDTHGDIQAWRKAVELFGELDLLLHAGDVLYHGVFNPLKPEYYPRDLSEMLNGYSVPMMHARGNCDSEVDQMAMDNHILSDFAIADIQGVRVLVNHGHVYSEERLAGMAKRANVKIVHRGHTHVPGIKLVDGIVFVNGGSPSLPKQESGIPTVGLLENGLISILDIDSGEVLETMELAS